MPPMIATPVAIRQSEEQKRDQEFELDIRVSSVSTLPAIAKELAAARAGGRTIHTACTRTRCCTG